MDLQTIQTIWNTLNQGISSEAIGGLTSTAVLTIIKKMKTYFSNPNDLKEEEFISLVGGNSEFKELSKQLHNEINNLLPNANIETVGAIINGGTISGGVIAGKINVFNK